MSECLRILIDCSQLSRHIITCCSVVPAEKITHKASDAAENLHLTCCSVLPPKIVMHDAYIGGRSENNIKCVVHDDLGWKNRTTRYILPRHWLYE